MSLRDDVLAQVPATLNDLKSLVAIESVSADPGRASEVNRSAEAVVGLLVAQGCPDVRIRRAGDGAPAVIAKFPAPPGRPTVCLYAHHDVQPEGDRALWQTPPFQATAMGDRLYGRGVADDKGGLAMHLAALRAFGGKPPVGVTLIIEGEEEIGSPTIGRFFAENRDDLAADVYVIADSGNWALGEPAFTASLRGLVDCVVEVRTLDHGIHSGSYGGVVPDALTALCRLLATLHDEQGNVAIEGLATAPAPDLEYPADRLRAESGVLDGVPWIGDGTLVERMWCKPAISVIALDATPVAKASNTLIPSARAKISLRLAPGDVAERARAALSKHLYSHAPWGVRVQVIDGEAADPSVISVDGPYAEAARAAFTEAWGVAPVYCGEGGSIPMIAEFSRTFPDATILVTGVADPDTRAHGANESVYLPDFAAACVAEALMLDAFAAIERTA
jgi:acetylornithine deacetylase/succinyl-diaminopimelate desuccinylase-like protein